MSFLMLYLKYTLFYSFIMERLPGSIRRNNHENPLPRPLNLLIQPQPPTSKERPKSSSHRQIYMSKNYQASFNGNTKNLTLQTNSRVFYRSKTPKKQSKAFIFYKTLEEEEFKEKKIKMLVQKMKKKGKQNKQSSISVANVLQNTNSFFGKLQCPIVAFIMKKGKIIKYQKGDLIQSQEFGKKIGFILYGKLKQFNQDFIHTLQRSDLIGQNRLFSHPLNFQIKFISDSALLWFSIKDYGVLKEKAVSEGLRHELNLFHTQLRMNYIRKKLPR